MECWCIVRIHLWIIYSKPFAGIFMVSINLRNSVESLRYEGRFYMWLYLSANWDMGSVILLATTGYNWSYSPWDSCKFFSGSKVWMCVSVLEVCKFKP